MMSRRLTSFSSFASASALRTYSAVSSFLVRALTSTVIGVRGNARSTSRSVGTRKSLRVKPRGGRRLPVATPRRRYALRLSPWR